MPKITLSEAKMVLKYINISNEGTLRICDRSCVIVRDLQLNAEETRKLYDALHAYYNSSK